MLWPMDMRMFISYFHDAILSAACSIDDCDRGSVMANGYEIVYQLLLPRDFFGGCLIDDRDSRAVWLMNMRMLISYFHEMILAVSCSIDDRDRRSVMANECENTDQLPSRSDSFDGLIV